MDTWQLCPKCKGTGWSGDLNGRSATNGCDLCNGAKIISIFTGRPPQTTTTSNSSTITSDNIKL